MRYPSDYIQIGAQKVGVEIVKTRRDDDFTFGESDPHAGKMSLYADLSPANAVDTVLHEVTHFLMCGLPISKKDDEYLANVEIGRASCRERV